MNKCFFIGNLTRDPESRTNTNGKSACNFTIAVNGRGANQSPLFVRVTAWDKLGENCQKYLAKGKKVAILGQLRDANAYINKEGKAAAQLEVWADEVEFLSPSGEGRGQSTNAAEAPAFTPAETDQLPF